MTIVIIIDIVSMLIFIIVTMVPVFLVVYLALQPKVGLRPPLNHIYN
jgi:hypothetical protein